MSVELLLSSAFKNAREPDALAGIAALTDDLPAAVAYTWGDKARRKRWYRVGVVLLTQAGARASDPLPALTGLVECRVALRDWPSALAGAEQVLEIDPRHRRMLRQKAYALRRLGREAEALAILQTYAGIASRWSEPWIDMVRIHLAGGAHARAILCAREALQRDANDLEMIDALIVSLIALGREAEAEEPMRALARREPNRMQREVRMYLRMGRPLAAAYACRALLGARGESVEVAATVLTLRGALTQPQGLPAQEAARALRILDEPLRQHTGKRGFAERLMANLGGSPAG